MNVHPQTAAYRVMIFAIRMLFELAPCPMPRKTVMKLQQKYFLSDTLAQTFNNRSFRIDWCGNYLISQPTDIHSSRRSGGIFGTFFLQKKVRPPRLWAEWNYMCLVPPSTRNIKLFYNNFHVNILCLLSWNKRHQKFKKERCFHRTGQNTWPAVLSSHRTDILLHLVLIFISQNLTGY